MIHLWPNFSEWPTASASSVTLEFNYSAQCSPPTICFNPKRKEAITMVRMSSMCTGLSYPPVGNRQRSSLNSSSGRKKICITMSHLTCGQVQVRRCIEATKFMDTWMQLAPFGCVSSLCAVLQYQFSQLKIDWHLMVFSSVAVGE